MICHDLLDAPWLITEPAFHELHKRSQDAEFVRAAMSFLDQFQLTNNDRPLPYDLYGSVAVIPCVGIFSKRTNWWSWWRSGWFTADCVQFAITHAITNPVVKSIVLDIESPGGTVAGTMELADYIFQARGHGKRIIAVVNELCASAALWIGTAAHEVVTTAAGRTGSLGVLNARYDYTGMNERMGLKVHLFSSGECKTFGNPDAPLTDAEKAYQQDVVAVYAKQFTEGVARNRGVSFDEARSKWANARVWIGQAAVDVGLADRVATLDSVVAELSGQPNVTVTEKGSPDNGQGTESPDARSTARVGTGTTGRYHGSRRIERWRAH